MYYVIEIVMVEVVLIHDDDIVIWLLLHNDVMLRVRNIGDGMVA